MRSFFAALSLILSTNATIRASYQKNIYSSISLSILPRLSYNTLSIQNFNFESKLKLDHFQPILFKNCHFASAVDLNSHAPLYLRNCNNISGAISSSADVIFVFNSTFSQNFVKFDIRGCKNCSFIKSNFSTKSSERVISLKNSQSHIVSCNFNSFLKGSIISIESNLFVANSTFKNIKSDKGAAIYFLGEKLVIDNCLFEQCKSTVAGGAVYFLANESIIRKSNFVQNDSPVGKSIFFHYYQESKPILDGCYFTDEIKNEVVERSLDKKLRNNYNLVKKLLDFPVVNPTRTPIATLTQSPSPSRSPSPSASASQSPTASKSPIATQTPRATPTMIEVRKNNEKYYITAVAVICAAVVVVVIIVVVVVLVKKKKNRIYPKTDSDEAEPQGVSVIVNRIYSNSTKTVQEEA